MMADENPYRSPAEQSPPPQSSPTIYGAIWNAWVDLFRSRSSLLLKTYSELLGQGQPDTPVPTTLEDARERFLALTPNLDSSAREAAARAMLDLFEPRMLLGTRLIAAWITFWTTLLPLIIILAVWIFLYVHRPSPIEEVLIVFPFKFAVFFPILAVIGLAIQALLLYPFNWVLNRLLAAPAMQRE